MFVKDAKTKENIAIRTQKLPPAAQIERNMWVTGFWEYTTG